MEGNRRNLEAKSNQQQGDPGIEQTGVDQLILREEVRDLAQVG